MNFGVEDADAVGQDAAYKVWIDCLMWLRNELPASVLHYDIFLAESFFEIKEELLLGTSQIQIIPPLFSSLRNDQSKLELSRKDHILISFGGIETPFTQDVHRYLIPLLVLKSFIRALKKLQDSRELIVCTPRHLAQRLSGLADLSTIRFLCPTHKQLLHLMEGASLYIVQPGLYGPFEAFERRVPTFFCLPFSYTQICQARKYEEYDLLGKVPLWPYLNEEAGPLYGEIKAEESECFHRIANWLKKHLNQKTYNNDNFLEWAEMSLSGRLISRELTERRSDHVKSCRNYSDKYLDTLAQIIS